MDSFPISTSCFYEQLTSFFLSRSHIEALNLFRNNPSNVKNGIVIDLMCKKLRLLWTYLDFQVRFRPCFYCFVIQTTSQSISFLLERDCLFMGNMRIVLCIGVAKLLGAMWEKCYCYRLIPMLHLILLENKSFEFFAQSLKKWCCTFKRFFRTIFYFVRWVGFLMGRNCEKVILIFIFRRSSNWKLARQPAWKLLGKFPTKLPCQNQVSFLRMFWCKYDQLSLRSIDGKKCSATEVVLK